jgi:hypothetical protein
VHFRCRTSPIPKTGVGVYTKHEFLPPELFLRFSKRTCPIHYFRSKTHVWGGFTQFRCRTSPILQTGVEVHTSTCFCHRNHFFVFRNEHAQSTTLGPKLMFGVVFAQFRCRTSPIQKTGVGAHTKHEFSPPEPFLRFHNEHAQSTTLGPKLMFSVVSRKFVAARHPFRKRVSGCIQSMSFRHRNHFFVFHNEHAQCTTLGPKLMFGVVSRNFVAARHPFGKTGVGVHTKHEFLPPEPFLRFPKLMFGVVSRNFVAARHPFRKRVSGCIQSTCFCHQTHFVVFCNEHAQSTTLGPKLMFRWFRAISLPHVTHSENGCRGAYKALVFATGTISSFCATNMPNPLL